MPFATNELRRLESGFRPMLAELAVCKEELNSDAEGGGPGGKGGNMPTGRGGARPGVMIPRDVISVDEVGKAEDVSV